MVWEEEEEEEEEEERSTPTVIPQAQITAAREGRSTQCISSIFKMTGPGQPL